MDKQKVLFLCTGNSALSQMAEAFVPKYGDDIFEPHSAGLEPKGMNPLTVKVMSEVGSIFRIRHRKALKPIWKGALPISDYRL